jgi:EmrB/QacA subfamily drug resistance transporter
MHRLQLQPKVSVSIVFVAALFMSIMDTTIVNVALPTLGRELRAPSTSLDAVVVGYLISLAAIIPASGWLGDRWGTKRMFLFALALFSVASALCGLAPNFSLLVGFRVLQGIGGGALTPIGTAILYRTFPPAERIQVSRILIIPTVVAPAVGPVLGGLLVDQLSWRWVFFVNVPIGMATLLFGLLFLQEHREPAAGRFDLAGFLLAGIGLALVTYALSEGSSAGWTSTSVLTSALAGLLVLVVFTLVELRTREPMLDLRLFGNRLFRSANLVTLFSSAGFLGILFAAPLFLQEARGVSALTSGLTTFPEALGVVLSTQLVARLYPSIGPRRLMAAGLSGVAIVMSLLSLIGSDTPLWLMRVLMFLIGAGMAYAMQPAQVAAFATISSASTGRASALNNAQRQVGAALGVAVLSSVISAVGATRLSATGATVPNLAAYHAAFFAAAVLELIAVGWALTIHDSDAAVTLRRPARQAKEVGDARV